MQTKQVPVTDVQLIQPIYLETIICNQEQISEGNSPKTSNFSQKLNVPWRTWPRVSSWARPGIL